jgi:hypothetical protein
MLVEIFNEIKVVFDDAGDFKWYSVDPIVDIRYSYLAGNRNMAGSFLLMEGEYAKTDEVKTHINRFLERMESATRISINAQMTFSPASGVPNGTYDKSVTEAFVNSNLGTIQSAEGIKIVIRYLNSDITLSDFQEYLKDSKTIIDRNPIKITSTKYLPNNVFSGDSDPGLIEKLPANIIKDFTEFVDKIRLSNADKKELIDIINRGISGKESNKI